MRILILSIITLASLLNTALAQDNFSANFRVYPTLSILSDSIGLIELEINNAINNGQALTIIAPTDTGFESLAQFLNISLDDLLLNEAVMKDLLLYHVIVGRYTQADLQLQVGSVLPTLLEGAFVSVNVKDANAISFNNVGEIVTADIDMETVLTHIIDDGLLNRVIIETLEVAQSITTTPAPTSEPLPEATTTPIAQMGYVRFVHLSDDAPPMYILVNGVIQADTLDFTSISDFVGLTPDTYEITFSATNELAVTVALDSLVLKPNNIVTVVLYGSLSNQTLAIQPYREDWSQNNVLFIHTLQDVEGVDVVFNDQTVAQNLPNSQFVEFSLPVGVYQPTISSSVVQTNFGLLSRVSLWVDTQYLFALIGSPESPQWIAKSVPSNIVK